MPYYGENIRLNPLYLITNDKTNTDVICFHVTLQCQGHLVAKQSGLTSMGNHDRVGG